MKYIDRFQNSFITGKSCTFLIGTKCNLKCKHCFITEKYNNEEKIISKEIIDKTFEFIDSDYKIVVMGGEPLLYPNIVKYIFDKIREKGAEGHIVTNSFWSKDEKLRNFIINDIAPNAISLSVDEFHEECLPIEYVKEAINFLYGKTEIIIQAVVFEENNLVLNSTFLDKKVKELKETLDIGEREVNFLWNPLKKEGEAKKNNIGNSITLCEKGVCSINGFIIDYEGNFGVKCENSNHPRDECKLYEKNILKNDININSFYDFVKSKRYFTKESL
jgi:MoaA/NifB/PqqE/SkfB family radical SAM enzyme